jgi:hypothetical protein
VAVRSAEFRNELEALLLRRTSLPVAAPAPPEPAALRHPPQRVDHATPQLHKRSA